MITIFDIFQILCPMAGLMTGVSIGSTYWGFIGGIIGALGGFIGGFFLGKIPWMLAIKYSLNDLSKVDTEQLLTELREQRSLAPNVVLLELARRGYDIFQEVDTTLSYLDSKNEIYRSAGYVALKSAFPNFAADLGEYSPFNTIEDCRDRLICNKILLTFPHS